MRALKEKVVVKMGPAISVLVPVDVHNQLTLLSEFSGDSKSELAAVAVEDMVRYQMEKNKKLVAWIEKEQKVSARANAKGKTRGAAASAEHPLAGKDGSPE